ncbi:MAG: hypothetical protein V7K89_27125 [Nostoc sp.]|uniref:hypothetical protein n=1 Tax=Nostoc sp. TaxID=1180 RepID=UPI002FFA7496
MPTINGTNRPDNLGNSFSVLPNIINGFDGNNTINGKADNDIINTGSGNDI